MTKKKNKTPPYLDRDTLEYIGVLLLQQAAKNTDEAKTIMKSQGRDLDSGFLQRATIEMHQADVLLEFESDVQTLLSGHAINYDESVVPVKAMPNVDVVRRFMFSSFKDIDYQHKGLTPQEKACATPGEFKALMAWLHLDPEAQTQQWKAAHADEPTTYEMATKTAPVSHDWLNDATQIMTAGSVLSASVKKASVKKKGK